MNTHGLSRPGLFALLPLMVLAVTIMTLSAETAKALECENAGAAPSTVPNDGGLGDAVACGDGALAAVADAIALGSAATVGFNAYSGIAIGDGAVVQGSATPANAAQQGIAIGKDATSSGVNSLAMGHLADADSEHSTAMGYNASAAGLQATAVGALSSANFVAATAFGRGAETTGSHGTALGYVAQTAVNSIAVGSNSLAGGSDSVAIGAAAKVTSSFTNAIALGRNAQAFRSNAMVLGSIPGFNAGTDYVDIANGTPVPQASLHVARNNGMAQILVEDTNVAATPKTLFKIKSNFNAKFEIDNTDGALWAFTNAGTDFRISRQGSGVVEFSVANNGNATLAGALTQNSDLNAKQDIVAVNPDEVLEKVAALPVSTWAYRDAPNARHLGPMAQDFHAAFGLGDSATGLSSIDTGGVALAAIQALETRNRELEARVIQLESMLNRLMPQIAASP